METLIFNLVPTLLVSARAPMPQVPLSVQEIGRARVRCRALGRPLAGLGEVRRRLGLAPRR
jgi:hypothetical protein